MRAIATALALALFACTTEPSSPTPDDVGDGDGDMGDGDASGDGDGDEPPADLPGAMLDVPADGLPGCCICAAPATCETNIPASESAEACEIFGEQWSSPWEWHADCYYDAGNLHCPGSCAD